MRPAGRLAETNPIDSPVVGTPVFTVNSKAPVLIGETWTRMIHFFRVLNDDALCVGTCPFAGSRFIKKECRPWKKTRNTY